MPNRFKKGSQIQSFERLIQLLVVDEKYVYFRDRPVHPKFLTRWSMDLLSKVCAHGGFYHAEPNEEFILYEVWEEGYAATGEGGPAGLVGRVKARTFAEACDKLCGSKSSYNSERLSVWGCRLFDNEFDARRSSG